MSIGEKSRMMLKDLGNVAGLYDVTGQSGYPGSIINVEQIMDAPQAMMIFGHWSNLHVARL